MTVRMSNRREHEENTGERSRVFNVSREYPYCSQVTTYCIVNKQLTTLHHFTYHHASCGLYMCGSLDARPYLLALLLGPHELQFRLRRDPLLVLFPNRQ